MFYINIFPLSCKQSSLMHETTPFTGDSQDKSKIMTRNKLYASMRTKGRTSIYCACVFFSLVQTAFSASDFSFLNIFLYFCSDLYAIGNSLLPISEARRIGYKCFGVGKNMNHADTRFILSYLKMNKMLGK